MSTATPDSAPPRLALLSCSVFDGELALLSPHTPRPVVHQRLEMGLHDSPDTLRDTLQAAIDGLEPRAGELDAIVLLYGVCGRGTDGLQARSLPLVIARAHDCITHFLGCRHLHASRQVAYPDSYYYTPGWNAARRVPGPERLESLRRDLASRFAPEDVDFLLESERAQWAAHGRAVFIDQGTPDAATEAAYTRRCADWLGWDFEHLKGDLSLLLALLSGHWDEERFQRVAPGETLRFRADNRIFSSGCP